MRLTEKQTRILGTIATITAVSMYMAYIPQIQLNLEGIKGTPIQPAVAAMNGAAWVIYALFKKSRDWPVALANMPAVPLGLITAVTALI